MKTNSLSSIALLACLAGCTSYNPDTTWVPPVDTTNDPHIAMLRNDLGTCQLEALHASTPEGTPDRNVAGDAGVHSKRAYRGAYTACMKQLGHPIAAGAED